MFGRKQPHEESGGTPDEGGVLPLKKAKPTAFSPELARRREDDGRNKGEAGMTADAKTLVIHPGSTTHQQMDADSLAAAGISEGLVRLSVGLEDIDDLRDDLAAALKASQKAT